MFYFKVITLEILQNSKNGVHTSVSPCTVPGLRTLTSKSIRRERFVSHITVLHVVQWYLIKHGNYALFPCTNKLCTNNGAIIRAAVKLHTIKTWSLWRRALQRKSIFETICPPNVHTASYSHCYLKNFYCYRQIKF